MRPLAQHVSAHAVQRPGAPAYLGAGAPFSWSEYDGAGRALASLLRGEGIGPGERVGVLLPDGPGVHAAFLGCEQAGVVAVGIGPRAGPREIEHLLRLTGAAALLSRSEHADLPAATLADSLRRAGVPLRRHFEVEVEGELRAGDALRVDGALRRLEAGPAPAPTGDALSPHDLFLLNSTSGTSGMPKCVAHDQARWFAFHELAVPRLGLSPSDRFMSVVPAPFGFGIWTSHVTPALLGVPTVVMPRFDAAEALGLVERHRVSVLAAVSTQFIMMLEALEERPRDLSSLRVLTTGGEAVPYERAAAFEDATGCAVLQFYGSNETGAVSGTSLADDRERRLRTAGRVIPEMRVRLFDADGNDVTATGEGQPGCRGPTLSRGYYGEGPEVDAANAALVRDDGWFLLGDRVTVDADGYLTVVGRIDDFIIRGGKNISGPGVEEQVATHPAVSLAAAVAMPDPVFGERVCVYVELREGAGPLDLEALTDHLAGRGVTRETWPERLVVVDALPRGSGGKVAKQRLREDIRRRLEDEAVPAGAGPRA